MKVEKQISMTENDLYKKTVGKYPFECSGGMIRNAFFDLVHDNENIELIVADEPTPGMDLKTAVKTLSRLREIANSGKSVILITHDIDLAIEISDRIAVFYGGTILEVAKATDFEQNKLQHPYTKALYDALPQNAFNNANIPVIENTNERFKDATLC